MKLKISSVLLFCLLVCTACSSNTNQISQTNSESKANEQKSSTNETADSGNVSKTEQIADNKNAGSKSNEPKTVREFFTLLPDKYFTLEGCDRPKDKNCDKARAEYLKNFLEVEDTANGYMKGGCDGGQACFTMAIFKRPDGKYIVGLDRESSMSNDYYFLDYSDGKWTDVSAQVIPQFSKKNMYELPRKGTTVQVFAKNITEQGDDYEVSERGAKLYDLEWKEGKFNIKK